MPRSSTSTPNGDPDGHGMADDRRNQEVPEMRLEHQELLRRLAVNDVATLEATLGSILEHPQRTALDARTHALARVAALIAAESAVASYLWAVDSAIEAGA